MIIGVPKEIKASEYRVSMLPVGVEALVENGHKLLIEEGAGVGSGILDGEYISAGAEIVNDRVKIYTDSDLIVKVKEPLAEEYELIREDLMLFTYFHFAADEKLTLAMIKSKAICIAYETIQTPSGELPLLTPMSEVAGKMSIQEGAKYLEKPMMGRGILLGGVPGVEPAKVLVVGGGVVGTNAAKVAAGLGAQVTIMDINLQRLRYLDDIMPKNVVTVMSDAHNLRDKIKDADLVIGAVLIPGSRTPKLITEKMVSSMKPGAVIVDVSVDQGGCVETTRPTTHENPTFLKYGVVHYCVTNMPGAVGRTSTYALANVTLPYVKQLADKGWRLAMIENPTLMKGLNIASGKMVYKAIADEFKLPYVHPEEVIYEEMRR